LTGRGPAGAAALPLPVMNVSASQTRLPPTDWLLAETMRELEESRAPAVPDDAATAAAARLSVPPVQRIVARARMLDPARRVDDAVAGALRAAIGICLAFGALGLLAGAGAATAIRTTGATLAVSHALIVLLGVPWLMLLVWLVLSLLPGRGRVAAGLPGRLGWAGLRLLERYPGAGPERRALANALTRLTARRGAGIMALITHVFWSGFFVGAIGALWLGFLGLRYDFAWETTILPEAGIAAMLRALALPPHWILGIDMPSTEQVAAVMTGRSAPAERTLWATWLLAVLAVWGLLPRLALAAGFAWYWRRMRLALDLDQPGYRRLLPLLAGRPAERSGARGDPPPREHPGASARGPGPGPAPAVIVGVELDGHAEWPPPGCDAVDLGRADARGDRADIMAALHTLEARPAEIIARCSALRTPDRGLGRWLEALRAIAPVLIELQDVETLDTRGIEPRARLADWQRLAQRHGLPEPRRVASSARTETPQ